MAAIKPLDKSSEKWSGRASNAVNDLIEGVNNPRRSWKASSKAAEDNYRQSVVAAANEGRYGRGLDRTSDADWAAMTEAKAAARYPEGVKLGEGAWQSGFSPYHEVISRLTLPKRSVRGSADNYKRAQTVGSALNAARTRILSGK